MSTTAAQAVGGAATGAAGRPTWSTRLAFILAAAGSSVGLGNIWKFPYITGEYGGGAFVLFYLGCIAAIGLPVMMTEVMLGRRARRSPIGAMRYNSEAETGRRRWGFIGVIATLTAFLILSFYSVIAGWALPFVLYAAGGAFTGTSPEEIGALYGSLMSSPADLTIWHTLFMALTVAVSAAGVRAGVERAVRWLMPALAVMLVMLVGYNFANGAMGEAAAFLFRPDFSKLSAEGMLVAMGHSFFTLSLASGAMMAYGSYLPSNASIARASVAVVVMDTVIALTAGLAIFPIVLGNGLDPSAGPGLVFQTLPIAFGQMPGGVFFGTLFFVLLVVAAWTSSLSLLESQAAWLEEKGLSRSTGAIVAGVAAWLVGLTTVFSLNIWSGFAPLDAIPMFEGKTLFDIYNFLTANIFMPLGGLLMAVFAGWVMSRKASAEVLGMSEGLYRVWLVIVRLVVPAAILVIFVTNFTG